MPWYEKEDLEKAREMTAIEYLKRYEPQRLKPCRGLRHEYELTDHDSFKINEITSQWHWKSRDIGGISALNFLVHVNGMSFLDAVGFLLEQNPSYIPPNIQEREMAKKPFALPERAKDVNRIWNYLKHRGISRETFVYCVNQGILYESLPYHNAVFIGYDEKKSPKYAAYRATNQSRIMGDCTGSKKQYSFRLTAENTGEVHLFECAIDLLSYATLMKLEGKDWRQFNLVSLAGVYSPKQKIEDSKVPVTLGRLLEKDKTIRRIVLHLDNDIAGRKATKALQTILSDKYEVVDDPPQYGKDVNDFLCKRLGIKDKTERSFAR